MPPATKKPQKTEAPPVEAPAEPSAAERIAAILKRPFRADQLGWKVQAESKSKEKCLVVPYIDARDVQNRLDEAVGIFGWRTSMVAQADASVLCRLELRQGEEWVGKEDVGGQSDQPDEGDRAKAAVSDAFKRAAVHWGVGRYIYYLPAFWVAYDAEKRKPLETPSLPHWALPPKKEQPAAPAEPQQVPDSSEFLRKLQEHDASLAAKGRSDPGDLVKVVAAAGKRDGFPADLTTWSKEQVECAREVTKDFTTRHNLVFDLLALLDRKGAKMADVIAKLNLPPATGANQMTAEQLRAAVARLAEMPDAVRAAS